MECKDKYNFDKIMKNLRNVENLCPLLDFTGLRARSLQVETIALEHFGAFLPFIQAQRCMKYV
jgi:hypothetical protein